MTTIEKAVRFLTKVEFIMHISNPLSHKKPKPTILRSCPTP
jgi:hypothetical protein